VRQYGEMSEGEPVILLILEERQGEQSAQLYAVWNREKERQPGAKKLFDEWIRGELTLTTTTTKASASEVCI
jgi:hypothetical protein